MEEYNHNIEELYLYTVNDGDLYRSKALPIMSNLAKKMFAERYDKNLAVKAWMYMVEDALRKYNKEFPEEPLKLTRDEKNQVALEVQDHYEEQLQDTYEKLKAEREKKAPKKSSIERRAKLSKEDMDEVVSWILNNEELYNDALAIIDIMVKSYIDYKVEGEHRRITAFYDGFIKRAIREYNKANQGYSKINEADKAECEEIRGMLYDVFKEDIDKKLEELQAKQSVEASKGQRKAIGEYTQTKKTASEEDDDEKLSALKKYLIEEEGLASEDLEDCESYNDNEYTFKTIKREYEVLTPDEAWELAKNEVLGSFDEMGIEAFTPGFQETILTECVDREQLDSLKDNDIEEWVNNISDEDVAFEWDEEKPKRKVNESKDEYLDRLREELIEKKQEEASDGYQYFEDMLGRSEMGKFLEETGVIDTDKMAELAVSEDGVGHFISYYDGDTIDLDGDLQAFRTN